MEWAKIILENGSLVVMASLFIYSWVQDREKTNKSLDEISKSNANIAETLLLLKFNLEHQTERIDKQTEKIEKMYLTLSSQKGVKNERENC